VRGVGSIEAGKLADFTVLDRAADAATAARIRRNVAAQPSEPL
jgi:cytosine/adenosine deaminase-related metal-dependent hydrolase